MSSTTHLKFRLIILVLVALIPAMGLIFYNTIEARTNARAKAIEDTFRIINIINSEQQNLFEITKQHLIILSELPEIKEPERLAECQQLLSSLVNQFDQYANLGYTDLQGNIICSGVPLNQPTSLADKPYFQQTVTLQNFALGNYELGRTTNLPSINAGYPIYNSQNQLSGIVFISLDLTWIQKLAQNANLPSGSTVSMWDPQNTVLVRYPDPQTWVGKKFPESSLLNLTKKSAPQGSIQTIGLDNINRLYSYITFYNNRNQPSAHLNVGIPVSTVFTHTNRLFIRNLISLLIILTAALTIAWLVGKYLIINTQTQIIKAKDDFLNLATHQLRTPASGVKAFLSMLLDGDAGQLTPAQTDFIRQANDANDRQIKLINDLLNVGRIESDRFQIDKTKTDLNQLIQTVVSNHHSSAQQKQQTLAYQPASHPIWLLIDPLSISLTLNNLIDNAIKYTPEHGTIKINVISQPQQVQITVQDSGPGINPQQSSLLFKKFSRLDNPQTRRTSGSGLGLYIAQKIIQLHRGNIKLDPTIAKGSKFVITLPKSSPY